MSDPRIDSRWQRAAPREEASFDRWDILIAYQFVECRQVRLPDRVQLRELRIDLRDQLIANGDLLLDPVSRLLADWLPFPPRVEISTLGDAAVLTGALAVGLQAALENVFAKRPSLSADSVSGTA